MDQILRPLLEQNGSLPFSQFMALALYHQEFGYYSDPGRTRVGRGGDFATNISVGETFGRLLALRLHQFWLTHQKPGSLLVFELGPEDGSLALDILVWARALSPEFYAALRYHACEPCARKRVALCQRFAQANEEQLIVTDTPDSPQGEIGVILANEVLDALPVELFLFKEGRWHLRTVTLSPDDGEPLGWNDVPVDDPYPQSFLGCEFPEGYQTEVCPGYADFFRKVARLLDRGLFLFVDYGFAHDDYYHPDRTGGTLRTYAHHQAGDDPLEAPGLRDLTAHVNFTEAAAQAQLAELRLLGIARQESYLTNLVAPILSKIAEEPGAQSFIRQFRTLTHPGFFGSQFHVLELLKGEISPDFSFPCQSRDLPPGVIGKR